MNILASVNKIFELTNNYDLRFHEISSEPLAKYSLSLKKLEYKVFNLDEGDILLNDFLTHLRKFRYILSASPLPFSAHIDQFNEKDLHRLSRQCQLMYPGLKEDIDTVLMFYDKLRTSPEKPVLEYLRKSFRDKISTGLVLKTASDLNAVEEALKRTFITNNIFSVVTPSRLKKELFFDRLIILGPTYWYPDYIFHCPRSQTIENIYYDWQLYRAPRMEYFTKSEFKVSTLHQGCKINVNKLTGSTSPEIIEISDQIIDYKNVEKSLSAKSVLITPECVNAKLVGLTDAKGILFEDHSLKNIWTISLQADEQVSKCSVNELDTDCYLLIRTSTGRDYIQIKADEFLGIKAAKIRQRHSAWKKRLRNYTSKYHPDKICRYLRRHGGIRANETNLRNWASDDNIKPREYNDFLALMMLLKLEDHAKKLWKEADDLFRAHQRAGTVIRNLLIQEIKKSNLSKLELEQKMTFSLPDAENATFTAYKIEYISKSVYQVHPHQLRELIDLYNLGGQ
ncbi:hypothetical protein P4H46_23615 [Paenibacillus glucanolyticus]|uniref:hypothetical protein n=1 Tax=Paenibacillus glucanolyticus TaxID=59843 RepID=UPI0030C8EB43